MTKCPNAPAEDFFSFYDYSIFPLNNALSVSFFGKSKLFCDKTKLLIPIFFLY